MKGTWKKAACFLLAGLMTFGFAACGPNSNKPGGGTDSEGKKKLPSSEYEDDDIGGGIVDNTPEDPGTKVDHIFQAEAAKFDGVSTGLSDACIAFSQFFDLSFGGNVLMRNVADTKNSYTFEFNSDKAYKVTMELAIASAYSGGKWVDRKLSAMYEVVVNDDYLMQDVTIPAGKAEQVKGGNNYTCVQKVEVPISLKEGRNVIVFYVLKDVCNFDYMNIKTSANLTGWEDNYWQDPDTKINVKIPTAEAAGSITFSCSKHAKTNTFALPALAAGAGYIETEQDGVKTYSFELNGQTFSFSSDGSYTLPDGVGTGSAPVEPDNPSDPSDPTVPNVNVYGKRFFNPNDWTEWDYGSAPTGLPTVEDGALTFTKGARFDLFYISEGVHIADKYRDTYPTDHYGQDFTWKMKMSATNAFDMVLFGTSKLRSTPQEDSSQGGVFLTFENGKIKVWHVNYGKENADYVAEGTLTAPLDGTEFEVKIIANRLANDQLRFGIAINDQKVVFSILGTPQATAVDGDGNVVLTSTNLYGQRLCFVPKNEGTVKVYNAALPGNDYVEPEGPKDPTPAGTPSVIINTKEAFDPANWTTFPNGSRPGALPELEDGALKFADAARFEFFYVADGVHIGDKDTNIKDKSFYGTEFTWKLKVSATGTFDMILFANNKLHATPTDKSQAGVYLTFTNGKISVWHTDYGNEVEATVAEANVNVPLDGTQFEVEITAVRVDGKHLTFGIAVDGNKVEFAALGTPNMTVVEEGRLTIESNNMYGQRLCFVPTESTVVKLHNIALPGGDYAEPSNPSDPIDPSDPTLPSKTVNGKDFFDPANWTNFSAGDVTGGKPEVEENALKVTDATRFELFYISDGVHIADKATNLVDKDFYGKDYSWTLKLSATGTFDMILFGTNKLPAEFQKAQGGVFLSFENGKISVKVANYNNEVDTVIAEANVDLLLNGTQFELTITANRLDDTHMKFGLSINGAAVNLAAVGTANLATVADGFVTMESNNMFGQRICFVPQGETVVKIYDLTLPE